MSAIIRFGTFEVNLQTGELRRSGQRVKLQDQPFRVLTTLLQRPGELVTREELRSELWPTDTFVDFDHSLNAAIKRLRDALGESADAPVFIETMARRGYRFIAPISHPGDVAVASLPTDGDVQQIGQGRGVFVGYKGLRWLLLATVGAVLTAFAVSGYFHTVLGLKLTNKDTVVLADFANTTGDSVFDDTLKQALRVQMEQSPFLNILSERNVDEQLKLMGHSADERLTLGLARDLCQRANSKAVLSGSISRLGTHYVIGLSASRCDTGETLGSEQVEADNQEHVLRALGESAKRMRSRLGESLPSVQKYDASIEQATTPSLEALRAYSLGMKTLRATGVITALPFFQRAVELDPTFAMAYTRLGTIYAYLSQEALSFENMRKAYELRAKVSVRERLQIEQDYYRFVTWDTEKVVQLDEVWQQTYPQDVEPYHELTFLYARLLGNYEASLREALEAVRLGPDNEENYSNLCNSYRWLNRPDDAALVLEEAEKRGLHSLKLLERRYDLAFLKGDQGEIERLVATSTDGRAADYFTSLGAFSEAYGGKLKKSRKMLQAKMDNDSEVFSNFSLVEAHFGVARQARLDAHAALKVTGGDRNLWKIMLSQALIGDSKSVEELSETYRKRLSLAADPQHTLLHYYWLPIFRAALALQQQKAALAVELLDVTRRYELAALGVASLEPIYLRGQAYLMMHNGSSALGEFQKIVEHPGIIKTEEAVVGHLVRLGMARAYAMQGDTAKAIAAYQDFLTLWKDADPDIPILKEAKTEYAKLQ